MRLQAPFPVNRHLCFGDQFGLGNHVSFSKSEGSDPGGIKPTAHLADLMSAALKGKNPAYNERAHEVICRKLIVLLELPKKPDYPVCFFMAILRIKLPVRSGGITGNVCRQIDEVCGTRVLHIKESLLPFPARF